MGAVTASGAKQQRQSYNSKRGEELLKELHFFVWCLKHSLNTNTLLSSSLNEQIADWSKCWMIMAEDGCVGLLGDTMAFHSSPRSSVRPSTLRCAKRLSVCWIHFLCFSSAVMNMNHSRRKKRRGGTAHCHWVRASGGNLRDEREQRWKQKSLLWCQSRMHAYTLEGRMKKAGLLTGETMFLFKNK